jgi:hypothetical protein
MHPDSITYKNGEKCMAGWKRFHELKKMEQAGFDKTKLFSRQELKARGWTESLIKRFLPTEDATLPNPVYSSTGSPMKLYDKRRVKRIEASAKFQAALQASAKRKVSAKKAVSTKLEKMQEYLDNLTIEVPVIEKEELIKDALNSFRSLEYKNDYYPSDERMCVNYLRHRCTRYEHELHKISGKTGAVVTCYEKVDPCVMKVFSQYGKETYDEYEKAEAPQS